MNVKDIHSLATADEVASAITNYIIQLASKIDRPIHVAISGGSTPETLFAHWLRRPKDLFSRLLIHFWWVDERLVPDTSNESNYGNAFKHYFQKVDYPSNLLHPIPYSFDSTPHQMAIRYNHELVADWENSGRPYPLDLVLLGVGDDGHTSSLFPNQDLYAEEALYIPSVNPYNGIERVALSYHGILSAPRLVFHVIGSNKREILERVITPMQEKDEKLPAAYVMACASSVLLFTDIDI